MKEMVVEQKNSGLPLTKPRFVKIRWITILIVICLYLACRNQLGELADRFIPPTESFFIVPDLVILLVVLVIAPLKRRGLPKDVLWFKKK